MRKEPAHFVIFDNTTMLHCTDIDAFESIVERQRHQYNAIYDDARYIGKHPKAVIKFLWNYILRFDDQYENASRARTAFFPTSGLEMLFSYYLKETKHPEDYLSRENNFIIHHDPATGIYYIATGILTERGARKWLSINKH